MYSMFGGQEHRTYTQNAPYNARGNSDPDDMAGDIASQQIPKTAPLSFGNSGQEATANAEFAGREDAGRISRRRVTGSVGGHQNIIA